MAGYTGLKEEAGATDPVLQSESTGGLQGWSRERLVNHLRFPLYRNAYAWLLSTGVSSALGILYWLLAAHLYTPESVGVNATLVSAMILISGISQLNLMSALVRFVPVAGEKTRRLVSRSYVVAVLLSLLVAGIAVLLGSRIPQLDLLGIEGSLAVYFVLATGVWGIFALQDSVLTGMRATVWVPAENIAYGIAKIILLWLLAPLLPAYGIFASWVLPVLLLVLPINLLIFRRLIPGHVAATPDQARPFATRSFVRYITGNYLAWLFFLAAARLIPVLVAAIAGASSAAYFYMAWTVASSLRLVVVNMTTSLTVEGAADERQIVDQGIRFLRNLLRLFVPLVALTMLLAPLLLRLAGRDYQQEGVALLRLLILSVLPAVISVWYIGLARARQQVGRILLIEGTLAVLALGLSVLLLARLGITGVGWAWLVAESAVAALLLLVLWHERRQLRQGSAA